MARSLRCFATKPWVLTCLPRPAQSFLTAGLQNFARRQRIPIDEVAYDFEVLGTDPAAVTEAPADGVAVYGLFLEGAAWDAAGAKLCESQPKVHAPRRLQSCTSRQAAARLGRLATYGCAGEG